MPIKPVRPGLRPASALAADVRAVLEPVLDLLSRLVAAGQTDALKGLTGALDADNAWRKVGAAGQPAMAAGWAGDLYFAKCSDGSVRLRGAVSNPGPVALPATIFTLPDGYRPDYNVGFGATDGAGVAVRLLVTGVSGFVILVAGSITSVTFDAVNFIPTKVGPDAIAQVVNNARSKVNEIISRLQED